MVSQPLLIGIVIAAFFVGLGSTYLIFHTGSSDVNAGFNMMIDTEHAQEMGVMMNENHNFTMEMMSVMLEDHALQLQMVGHMAESISCADAGSDCGWSATAETEEELMGKVVEHAKIDHKDLEITPELVEKIKSLIKDV